MIYAVDADKKLEIARQVEEAFPFDVRLRPLYYRAELAELTMDYQRSGKYELFRDDTLSTVSTVSVTDKYVPHTKQDVSALVQAAAGLFSESEEKPILKCHWHNGHIVSLLPGEGFRQEIFGQKDAIFPRVLIKAGYNGKCFEAAVGFYRDLCRNMSMLKSVGSSRVKIKHTFQLTEKLASLRDDLDGLRGGWREIVHTLRQMEGVNVSLPAVLTATLGHRGKVSEGRAQTIYDSRWDSIVTRVREEAAAAGRQSVGPCHSRGGEDPTVTGYQVYQGVQGYFQHVASRNGSPDTFRRMLMAQDNKIVHRCEQHILSLV